ncbi:MAG: C40 family peptidase, partial [Clostridia bacterium]|nr:C40 family peptidase [Clostridia bacterium]
PLTTENILKVAFTTLGDAYGWGGMLAEPDCSLYMRNVYKCFGLELPRNTTWQSAMPAFKTDLTDMEAEAKAKVLDSLPAGTILFLKGHEMMYLGEVNGFHYVISTMGSIMRSGAGAKERIRGVAINTLEESMRTNGATWLESLTLAIQPWLPASTQETDEHKAALPDAA